MTRRHLGVGAVLMMVMTSVSALGAQSEPHLPAATATPIQAVPAPGELAIRARALAVGGERAAAITLLRTAAVLRPDDSDTRVLLGTILGWDGQYDDARHELEIVLMENPTHGDALPAMIAVELAAGDPGRAEELTRRGLVQRPAEPDYLLGLTRALVALNRLTEARDTLERLFAIDPRNAQAEVLRGELQHALRLWHASIGTSYDGFSDGRAAWRESHVGLSRTTALGPVLMNASRAERFGLTDSQIGVEIYPLLRPGTYGYVAGAYSPDARLYPRYRYAADLYQSLGAGFEGAAGFRRLGFGRGVNIYVGSLAKYYGNWLFSGRVFVSPANAGTSRSTHFSVRRYIGSSRTHVGVRYGRGAWREEPVSLRDLEVLDSDVGAAEASINLTDRFGLSVGGSYSREDRVERLDLRQYSVSTGLQVRF